VLMLFCYLCNLYIRLWLLCLMHVKTLWKNWRLILMFALKFKIHRSVNNTATVTSNLRGQTKKT
jgi:hypothetical protein